MSYLSHIFFIFALLKIPLEGLECGVGDFSGGVEVDASNSITIVDSLNCMLFKASK